MRIKSKKETKICHIEQYARVKEIKTEKEKKVDVWINDWSKIWPEFFYMPSICKSGGTKRIHKPVA